VARDIDTHTHRVGRTGRAGEKGTAYTLVTEKDKEFVGHIVRNLEGAGQPVPEDVLELAMKVGTFIVYCINTENSKQLFMFYFCSQSSWFRKARFKQGKGKNAALVGACRGLGFKDESSGSSSAGSFSMPTYKPGLVTGSLVADSLGSGVAAPTNRLDAMKAAFKQQFMTSVSYNWLCMPMS